MNNELNSKLLDILQSVEDLKDFTVEQAPDVAQQLVYYSIAMNVFYLLVCLVIICIGYLATFKWTIQNVYPSGEWHWSKGVSAIVSTVASVGAVFSIVESVDNLLKLAIAPKLFILEYAAKLIG